VPKYLVLIAQMGSGPQSLKFCRDAKDLKQSVTGNLVRELEEGEWIEVVKIEPESEDHWQQYSLMTFGADDEPSAVAAKIENFSKT
jgi:hypothetical protein